MSERLTFSSSGWLALPSSFMIAFLSMSPANFIQYDMQAEIYMRFWSSHAVLASPFII
jgi:hypothetical protein